MPDPGTLSEILVLLALSVAVGVGIPSVAVEMNPYTVRDEREKGVPILCGDATAPETLAHAGLATARVAVIAISDAAATLRMESLASRAYPQTQAIARTRYTQEVAPLLS